MDQGDNRFEILEHCDTREHTNHTILMVVENSLSINMKMLPIRDRQQKMNLLWNNAKLHTKLEQDT